MTDVLRSTNLTATLPNGTTITGVVEYSPTTGNSKVKVRGLFGSTIGTRDIMVNGLLGLKKICQPKINLHGFQQYNKQ